MKTKMVITDMVSFILGIIMFFVAFAELLIFCIAPEADELTILFLALSLALKYMQDGTTKINFKEENNNEKREDK